MKKYEFTGETRVNWFGRTLHRIKALVKIERIEAESDG